MFTCRPVDAFYTQRQTTYPLCEKGKLLSFPFHIQEKNRKQFFRRNVWFECQTVRLFRWDM